ncbi:MAG: cyclase family protein [Thermoplasmata archaeon]|uniref:Cyclase family protein n=1 Tax=Candidatus Sysuiplasma superficiale TaxID=2823368 RepID=A0A8J7YNW0_9ARCH|nr:cyclase family protein [Candidatus Sysuiplasma superficiale]MBX8643953.1 cyclase family protein [Candidatus Sysuiplasma superficiale]MCL4346294.1 cyclase family protein [Candidatus Thermoplasmatota archaeon]
MKIREIIDLTVSLSTHMPVWATAPLPKIEPVGYVSRDGYNYELYSSGTHTGTHVDAPYHFDEHGKTVDEIPLETLIGDGYCISVGSRNSEIDVSELEKKWRKEYDGSILLLRTDWSRKRGFTKEFLYEFPGLSVNTVDFILKHRIKVVGIDTLGIDPYSHSGFDVHKALLTKGIPFIEDLCNLERLKEGKKYLVAALPAKLRGASGSMARVVAMDIEG